MTAYCKAKLDIIVVFRVEKFKNSNDKGNIAISTDIANIGLIFESITIIKIMTDHTF